MNLNSIPIINSIVKVGGLIYDAFYSLGLVVFTPINQFSDISDTYLNPITNEFHDLSLIFNDVFTSFIEEFFGGIFDLLNILGINIISSNLSIIEFIITVIIFLFFVRLVVGLISAFTVD